MSSKAHWQQVYEQKSPQKQTWYQRRPQVSLELIDQISAEGITRLIDVGGGASTLVDHLVDAGDFSLDYS